MTVHDLSHIPDRAAAQRRTLGVLRLAVVPGQAAVAGTVAVVSLLAKDMLGSDRLAGLASAAFTLGAAVAAIPLAAFMRRRGRRPGLALAFGIGAVGALVAATGGQARWFWLFIVGMVLFGSGQSATLQTRYAAADLATVDERATAIGAVVWIGTLGAVFGPVFTPLEKRFGMAIGLDEYVGPFLFAAALFALGAVFYLVLLRPDPLVLAGGVDPNASRVRPIQQARRSLGVIRSWRGAMLGLVAMAGSQASMVGVMTMTPPHMDDHGHADLSSMVIALHIVGMFGLAPLVGRFVDRVGTVRAIELKNWVATLTLGIQPGIDLPSNALARIGQTSLLGSQHVELEAQGEGLSFAVSILGARHFRVQGDSLDLSLSATPTSSKTRFELTCEGNSFAVGLVRTGNSIAVFADGRSFGFEVPDPLVQADAAGVAANAIQAPMPGLVQQVFAQAGQAVTQGEPLLVLEAMKMEHRLCAPRDGVVLDVLAAVGDQVADGTVLVALEPIDD